MASANLEDTELEDENRHVEIVRLRSVTPSARTESLLENVLVGWFPNLTRAYDNNGRCPRQKFVLGILQLYVRKTDRPD